MRSIAIAKHDAKSYAPDNQQLLGYRREVQTARNPVKRMLPKQTLEVQLDGVAG